MIKQLQRDLASQTPDRLSRINTAKTLIVIQTDSHLQIHMGNHPNHLLHKISFLAPLAGQSAEPLGFQMPGYQVDCNLSEYSVSSNLRCHQQQDMALFYVPLRNKRCSNEESDRKALQTIGTPKGHILQ